MARFRMFRSVRWPARMAVVVAAAVLGGGVLAGLPATAVTGPSPAPNPGANAGLTHAVTGPSSAAPPGVCSTNRDGKLVNCPKPVPKSQQPAGAKNQSTIAAPVSTGDLASLVDTRTWTTGGGNTYPGADVPFGMVQWSPDTEPHRSDGGGYSYGDTKLTGYSLTHISGPGCGAAGDVPILPMTGALPSGNPNSLTTSFSNTGEIAQAGYYSAQSNQPDTITSEFTATPHSSMGRFTFPATAQADLLVKLMDSQNGDFGDSAQVVSNTEITGTDTSGHFCGERNNDGQVQEYTVHFDIVFDHPFTASQVTTQSGQTDPAAVLLTFDTTSNQVVQAKVGISYVSTANARLNWRTENPGWDFGAIKSAAQTSWDNLLGRIQVSGGSYARTQEFYSLLYKDFMQPNVSSDVNGQYMGSDMQVHTLSPGQHDQYGTYSGWDIYHSLSQLQAMLDPSAASDQATSLVNYYDQDGILQQWGYLNLNNYVMVGDPAQSIIADYYAFGARNFDTARALADMLKQATTVNDVRPGEALEAKYGYLPEDGSYGCCNAHGQVPTLQEYDSQDLALSRFAAALGDAKDAAMLEQRANNWENVFNPADNLEHPRNEDGTFVPGITPTTTSHYVEGDAYEYLWNTPNDYSALFSLLGGPAKVAPQIRTYLSQPNGFGRYAQLTNEFDFGEQYMGDYAQDPAGTQAAVNNIRDTMYAPGPDLANNDDLGANSSTFIWEMLGMYPENSGSGNLVFNGPAFPQATISLPGGHTITINAPAASPSNYYVQNLKLNGRPYHQLYVPFSTLEQGATLDWTMGSSPSTWGTAPSDAPPSYTAGLKPVVGFASMQQENVPGGSATVQIGARNATGTRQSVQVTASAPSGVTVSPASGTINVPPNGQGTETVTVHFPGSAAISTSSDYPVTFSFTVAGRTVSQTVLHVVPPVTLAAAPSPPDLVENHPGAIQVTATNNLPQTTTATVQLATPAGWTVQPTSTPVTLAAGQSQTVTFTFTPPAGSFGHATLQAVAQGGGATTTLDLPATVSRPIAIVGQQDLSQDEFALAPDHYAQYPAQFPNEVDFTYGTSNPATDWSYIQPGPVDSWAGSRAHTFTFRFSLPQAPGSDLTFTAWLLDTQNAYTEVVQTALNGAAAQTLSLPPGGGDGYHWGNGKPNSYGGIRPTSFDITLPASQLHAGQNTVTITDTSGSWLVYDAFGIDQRPAT